MTPKALLPSNYAEVLTHLKAKVRSTQRQAATAVNRELISLYLEIGHQLAVQDRSWGKKVIERLALDLRAAFPGMKGFSRSNLFYMRQVYSAWAEADESVQQLVGLIPWGHHLVLVSKVAEPATRAWYLREAVEHGWSRAVLTVQIQSRLHERQGRALSNFAAVLPKTDSDLAQQTLKDPYIFDFLTLGDDARERDLEQGLLNHIQSFLLELGLGFAFAGKLNFYLSAIDEQMRHSSDNPTIGILLCKGKSRLVVEYALRGLNKPVGVADWEAQLVETLPEDLAGSLPSIEDLEAELLD